MVESSGPTPAKVHLIGLDFLRFFAALMVAMLHLLGGYGLAAQREGTLAHHFAVTFGAPAAPSLPDWLGALSLTGFIGVPIFFTISGFVIAYSATAPGFLRFIRNRFLRLWPALLICTSLAAAILLATGSAPPPEILKAFLRTMLFSPVGPYIDAVFWTIVLEVVFYLLLGTAVALFGKRGILLVCVTLALMGLSYQGMTLINGCGEYGHAGQVCALLDRDIVKKAARLLLFEHGALFATGISIWWLWSQTSQRAIAGLALAISLIAGAIQIDQSVLYEFNLYSSAGALRSPILAVSIWFCGVGFTVLSSFRADLLAKTLSWAKPALRTLGLATYPLYLLHVTVGLTTLCAMSAFAPYWLATVCAFIAPVTLSIVVAKWAEPWARGVIDRLIPRPARQTPVRAETLT